jgi:hypothetical protein
VTITSLPPAARDSGTVNLKPRFRAGEKAVADTVKTGSRPTAL